MEETLCPILDGIVCSPVAIFPPGGKPGRQIASTEKGTAKRKAES